MKKFLSSTLLGILFCLSLSAVAQEHNRYNFPKSDIGNPSFAGAESYEVICNLMGAEGIDTPNDLQFAVSSETGQLYRAFVNNSQVVFNLPEGKYDFIISFSSDMGIKLVVDEDVEVKANMEKTFISNLACFRTRFSPVDANGDAITFGETSNVAQGLDFAEARTYFLHKKGGLAFVSATYITEQADLNRCDVWSNQQSSVLFPFYLKGMSYNDGVFALSIYPEQVAIQKLSNDPEDWRDYDFRFAGSMLKESSEEIKLIDNYQDTNYFIALPEFNNYQYSWYNFYNVPSSVKHVCMKEEGPFGSKSNFIPMKVFGDYGSSLLSIMTPLIRNNSDRTTMVVSPQSTISQLTFSLSSGVGQYAIIDGKYCFDENPYFSYTYSDDMIFGNSCPLWIPAIVDRGSKLTLNYSFVGRLGETRSVDMANHNIDVLCGDKEVLQDFKAFSDSYGFLDVTEDTPVDIKVDNRNLLIDDNLQINGTAALHLVRNESPTEVPVVTMLQFRNSDGKPTDRFSADGLKLLLSAATFSSSIRNYWEIIQTPSELSSISAEYAPLGTDNYVNLTLEKGDYQPTYGWMYSASLDQLAAEEDGWYDLKLVATTASGSRMEQVISPAFKLGANLGIENLPLRNGAELLNDSDVEVYDMSGIRCDKDNLRGGFYILRKGSQVHKIMIPLK